MLVGYMEDKNDEDYTMWDIWKIRMMKIIQCDLVGYIEDKNDEDYTMWFVAILSIIPKLGNEEKLSKTKHILN